MQDSPGITIISWFTAVFFLLYFLFFFKPALAEETKPVENLPLFISTALDNNPELKASDARWQMFRNKIAQAGSFEDPMLMLKIQNGVVSDPFNFGKEPMPAKNNVMQAYDTFGNAMKEHALKVIITND